MAKMVPHIRVPRQELATLAIIPDTAQMEAAILEVPQESEILAIRTRITAMVAILRHQQLELEIHPQLAGGVPMVTLQLDLPLVVVQAIQTAYSEPNLKPQRRQHLSFGIGEKLARSLMLASMCSR